MRNSVMIALFFTIFSICQTAFGQANFDVKKMDQLFDALESSDRMMGSVTLTKDGKVIYQRFLGYREIPDKGKAKADAETIYRIGSITKVFTAVMIWQLIEEKKLTLETPLSRFFPNIPNADKITVAHLLSHTSGLHDYSEGVSYDPADASAWIYRPQTTAGLVARIAALKPDFAPGERRRYSNTNYTLLGYIIEAVTRSTYGKQLDKRIAGKLGLKRTRYDGKIEARGNEAYSYVYNEGKWNKNPGQELSVAGGAGGIVSTTREMAKFINALSAYKLISRNSLDKMTTPFDAKLPDSHLGIAQFTLRGIDKKAISKQGGIDAFTSDIVYVPEDRFAFALAINGNNYPKSKIFWSVMDIYYNRPVDIPSFKAITLPADALARFEGTFDLKGTGIKIVIKKSGTGLSGQATGQDAFSLEAISGTSFTNSPSGIIVEFRTDQDGAVQSFTLYQGRSVSVWEKGK